MNSELLEKYDVPGPRYTSYPTVPYWKEEITAGEWSSRLGSALEESSGAALYLHIPFCRSLCTYCGCNTRISRKPEVADPYVAALHREWGMYRERVGGLREFPLAEMHLGGGTPTFLAPDLLKALLEPLLETARVRPDAELSIEADPRVTTHGHLKTLAALGFNRISLGVQDFDETVQRAMNRVQSVDMVREVTESARALGFTSVNYDLIYGLPFQSEASVRDTVRKVAALAPDRIAFYSYAHVPWIKPAHRRWSEADLPAGPAKMRLYEVGREVLEQSGYREIGLDHFALETDELWRAAVSGRLHRNFMGYTSRFVYPLIGLGVSAIGDAGDAFAQNEKRLEEYYRRIEELRLPLMRGHLLSEEDRILRRHILNLTTRLHTEWDEKGAFTSYLEEVPSRLEEMRRDGLVEVGAGGCRITERGRPFLRNICMAFDARLARRGAGERTFSRTV